MTEDAALADPAYRAAVVDLLGVLAYGELMAFERLAADAALAPTITDEAELAAMANAEYRHFTRIRDRLVELGVDPAAAMAPFREPLESFHSMTAPSDWLEGLVKAYVGDGIGMDFYREIAVFLDPQTQALVLDVCADLGQSAFVVDRVRAAIEADPRVAGRLALWARRLVGEALSQAQHVAAEREALTAMLMGDVAGRAMDLTAIGEMFGRMTDEHTRRMQALGLSA
ncbi:MAG: hydroxylase [Actinomycetales bacterium mxb001]|nr:MAG: hydroxylase [Actinomycetales bacterium mxb001]